MLFRSTNPNYYNGVYKLSITLYSEDNKVKKLRFDSERSGQEYLANGEAHMKFLDPSIASIEDAVSIPNTNEYYAVVDDAGYTDRELKTYVYLEGHPAAEVSINNKKVNSDHSADNAHEAYYDVQQITIPQGINKVTVPLKITAQNNSVKEYKLVLYRKSAAIEVKEIEVQVKKADSAPEINGLKYPAIRVNALLKGMKSLGFTVKKLPVKNLDRGQANEAQLSYIKGMWELVSREKTEHALNRFVGRIAGVDHLRFLDVAGAQKVTLALRTMMIKAGYDPDGIPAAEAK